MTKSKPRSRAGDLRPRKIRPRFLPDGAVVQEKLLVGDVPLPKWTGRPWPRLRDLPVEQRKPLLHWLRGQTCPMIEGVSMKDQDGFYEWDYVHWLENWQAGRLAPIWD